MAEYQASWYARNAGDISARWRSQHSPPVRQTEECRRATAARKSREWYALNRDRAKSRISEYIKANPAKARAWRKSNEHNRRQAPGRISPDEVAFLLDQPCAYCGQPSEHVEHCTPLSRGGHNDIFNCVGACARCNLEKGRKTVLEFAGLIRYGN